MAVKDTASTQIPDFRNESRLMSSSPWSCFLLACWYVQHDTLSSLDHTRGTQCKRIYDCGTVTFLPRNLSASFQGRRHRVSPSLELCRVVVVGSNPGSCCDATPWV